MALLKTKTVCKNTRTQIRLYKSRGDFYVREYDRGGWNGESQPFATKAKAMKTFNEWVKVHSCGPVKRRKSRR